MNLQPALHKIVLGVVLGVSTSCRGAFTPTLPIPLEIISNAPAYAGGGYEVANLIDGDEETEFASANLGTNTFVTFRFGSPITVVAFSHVDRADRALVATSGLTFFDEHGRRVGNFSVPQAGSKKGVTFFALPQAVRAATVRWQVAALGINRIGTVGGAEIAFYSAGPAETNLTRDIIKCRGLPFADRQGHQPIQIVVNHPYLEPADVMLQVADLTPQKMHLVHGDNQLTCLLPLVEHSVERPAQVISGMEAVASTRFEQNKIRPMTIYVLPHSHTDVGYTALQTVVADKQVNNISEGIALAHSTANYPEGARFVWNVEALWAADLYLQRSDEVAKTKLINAVKQGQVELNGMYLNELTALCRPEELVQLFSCATKISRQTGVPIESAMISDVPGYTWGIVTALAQAGIRYLSAAPNYGERFFMKTWADKPFYWIGPDGKSQVLVWVPFQGYALSHIYDTLSPRLLDDLCSRLQKPKQPYDLAYIRWAGQGDNGLPDSALCDSVKEWNSQYTSPHFIISSTTTAFRALEKRYGNVLPRYQGDWTPYWEDGAASSARETALNRQSSDQLAQAETLFAMFKNDAYPVAAFSEAWRNVLLYSEHTWGAQGSVSEPEHPETLQQWAIKKSYADDASQQASTLIKQALDGSPSSSSNVLEHSLDVVNTSSWVRSDIVYAPQSLTSAGEKILDAAGQPVPSQRLKSGELAFAATNILPLAVCRFNNQPGSAALPGEPVNVHDNIIENGRLFVRLDPRTGDIVELRAKDIANNFANDDQPLNQYMYVRGNHPERIQTNGTVKISVGETGPLVASLLIDSDAPGCRSLQREIRLNAGDECLEIINRVNKARLEVPNYRSHEGKESVNFAFPFNVPEGRVSMDIPLATMQPGLDQLSASCTYWYTVGRWINFANQNFGITWVTLDAPMVQFESPSTTIRDWHPETKPMQTNDHGWYSWVMNNRWGTNYRAYQDGLVEFRYLLRPFSDNKPADTTRFATAFSQPLLVTSASSKRPTNAPLLKLNSSEVTVTAFKPSDDSKAWIIRLYGASGHDSQISLEWGTRRPANVFLSDAGENVLSKLTGRVSVPGYGLTTLRAEFE